MCLLAITLYELGQFLQIVLWIFLPLFIFILLFTTWFHYRRKIRQKDLGQPPAIPYDGLPETYDQNMYQALLWLQNRCSRLQEELLRARDPNVVVLPRRATEEHQQLEQLNEENRLLKGKAADYDLLSSLVEDKNRQIESLSRLLSTLYRELDRNWREGRPASEEALVGIASWMESVPEEPKWEPDLQRQL
jgi:hypothetical protein